MTEAPSIKEALQELRNANMSYSLVSDVKNARRLEQAMRDADRALATLQPSGERREAIALELLRRVRDYGGIEPQLDIEIDALLGSGNET